MNNEVKKHMEILRDMSKKITKSVLCIVLIFVVFLILFIYKAQFWVNVYDEQTREFVEMSYTDIQNTFNAQCVGTPGTGDSGFYLFEPKIAFPGFVTVKVEGYEPKTVFGFLGFNNKINIYLKKLQ